MTDDPTQDPSSFPPEGVDGLGVSEDDLDALLSEAAALAKEVSTEIGAMEEDTEEESQTAIAEAATAPARADNVSAQLDAELATIDELLNQAGSDLGAFPEEPIQGAAEVEEPAGAVEPAGAAAEPPPSVSQDIPDFMAEFTQPDGEPAAETPHPHPSSGSDVPDFMAEFTQPDGELVAPAEWENDSSIPDLSEPGAEPEPPAPKKAAVKKAAPTAPEPAVAAENVAVAESPAATASPSSSARVRESLRRVTTRVSPLALKVCEGVATALEVMDKPTRPLGPGPRQLLGWVAIATVGTSLIVFVVSLF